MTREEEVSRGIEAKRILENSLYQEAIQMVKDGIVSGMERSAMGDDKTHNRLVIALQLLNQIDGHLKTVMQTGQMANMQTDKGPFDRLRKVLG